jgi:type IV pilus assembly protein PilW
VRHHHSGAWAPRAQKGFTLVELLVALLIGLFLLGGLLTLVQDNRRTFGTQNQLAQLQDSERLAMTMMTDVIQAAGYFPDPTQYTAGLQIPAAGSMLAGQGLWGLFNAAAPGDSITVRYATASLDGIVNCIGATNSSGAIVPYTNVFSVVNGQLVCTLTDQTGTRIYPLVGAVTNTPNAIIVHQLGLLYGVDSAGAGTNVDTYVNASQVTNWFNVISVQITLSFNNPVWTAASPASISQYLTFQRVVGVMNQTGI